MRATTDRNPNTASRRLAAMVVVLGLVVGACSDVPTGSDRVRGSGEVTLEARSTGAGTIDLAGCATTDRLQIGLPGAGTIIAPDLDASTLRASLPGAGSIVATGRTDLLDLVLAGAGDFDGGDLRANAASVESTGVGTTTLWATDQLDVSVTGVGAVRYYGEPGGARRSPVSARLRHWAPSSGRNVMSVDPNRHLTILSSNIVRATRSGRSLSHSSRSWSRRFGVPFLRLLSVGWV